MPFQEEFVLQITSNKKATMKKCFHHQSETVRKESACIKISLNLAVGV